MLVADSVWLSITSGRKGQHHGCSHAQKLFSKHFVCNINFQALIMRPRPDGKSIKQNRITVKSNGLMNQGIVSVKSQIIDGVEGSGRLSNLSMSP